MRYHKAVEISKPEAKSIIGRHSVALSQIVVVSRGERYYDVRSMSQTEINAFIDDLARAEYAELEADAVRPC